MKNSASAGLPPPSCFCRDYMTAKLSTDRVQNVRHGGISTYFENIDKNNFSTHALYKWNL